MELALSRMRVRGWDEWPGLEGCVAAERLVKPDGELPRHLQLVERLAPVAGMLMCRFIAGFAQSVKQLRDLRVDDLAVPQLVDQFALGFVGFDHNADVGRRMLGQEFSKLAEFDQRRVWVIEDIAFGERGMADKNLVVLYEEREVRLRERLVLRQ